MTHPPDGHTRTAGPGSTTTTPAIATWIDGSAGRHYLTLIVSTAVIALANVLGAEIDWRVYVVMGSWLVANAAMTRWAAMPAGPELRLRRYAGTLIIDVVFLGIAYLLLDAVQYIGIAFFAHMALVATATLPRRWAVGIAALIVVVYTALVVLPVAGVVTIVSPVGLPPLTGNHLFVIGGLAGAIWTIALLVHLQTRFVRALRDTERKYAALVASASDMVITFDAGGRVLEVNPATLAQTGYSRDELHGRPGTALSPAADWPTISDGLTRTLAGETVEREVRYVRKDGRERWVHAAAFPVNIDEQSTIVVIARDVTDARQRHDALREKDQRLNIVLGALQAGFVTFDRDERVTSMLGEWARRQEAQGVPIAGTRMHDLADSGLPADVVARFDQARREVLAGREVSVAFTSRMPSGDRSVRSHMVPLRGPDGAIDGGVALWVDETALVAAERERTKLQQRIADVEHVESLGKLVSGVAHELNNPLAAILNFAEDLLADVRTPEEQQALEVIQSQALRSRTIVRDLLTYARRDVARVRTPAVPGPILHSVARAMGRGFATQGVHFAVEIADADTPIPLDRTGFEQVVTNLLTNAGQAAGAGGSVRLSTRIKDGWFEVIVEDNGAGIPPEAIDRMFEPFFTTKPTGQGVGLGLSVSAGIVQAHGGELLARNRPADVGGGARFLMRLPGVGAVTGPSARRPGTSGEYPVVLTRREDESAARVPIAEPASQPRALPERKPTILIIDDESAIRQGLRRFLTRRGWAVEESSDGADALAKLLRPEAVRIYDVVLCDLKMAGVSGIDVYERMLVAVPAIAQRFILSTGDTSAPDVAGFLAKVTVPVLEKPFELALLESLAAQVRMETAGGVVSAPPRPA